MGKAVPDALLRMWELLPEEIQDVLIIAVEKNRGSHGYSRRLSQSCPHCGGPKTMDCSTIDTIGDATVGLCLVCGYLWCLECDSSLMTGITCGHWQICSACPEEKEPSGFCAIVPWECPHIKEWLKRNHPVV